ncbi:MAG TPA: hypothetical protein V6C52_06950 [Coleofasciculaceae cyanobacterium]|jgi:hypothetical protein
MKKLLSKGLTAAAVLSLTIPVSAMAQCMDCQPQAQNADNHVKVSETLVLNPAICNTVMTLPQVNVLPGGSARLTAQNFSDVPLALSIPSLAVNQIIPPNSQEVIDICPAQTASLTTGQNVAYYVLDAECNRIASGSLFSDTQLAMLVRRLQVATVLPPPKPEPVYTERRATVRGFW